MNDTIKNLQRLSRLLYNVKKRGNAMKICVITGGANGLGFDMAEQFANRGYKVVVLDIVENKEAYVDYMNTDLADPSSIDSSFELIKEKYGKAHILINNGAVAMFVKNIVDVSLEDYNKILDTNLRGAFLCSKKFIELNNGENYGRIINISSTRWYQNMDDWELYGMSKGGIVSLTNSLCVSLRGTPITVNAISPGFIHVGYWKELEERDHEIHPSNRVGKPRDITNACLFLTDEQNDFVNGANIVIDGGMTKRMIY